MGIFICKICQKEFENLKSLSSHSYQKHEVIPEKIYTDYFLNGEIPSCGCGCGEKPSFISINKGFNKFVLSHHNRVPGKNNFHKNPETHQKAIETQKKNWKLGKYKGWWEDKSPETIKKIDGIKEKLKNDKNRGKKISDKLKGIPKTEQSKKKLSESQKKRYRDNPQLKVNQSIFRLKWMRENSKVKTSKLENRFMTILNEMGLKQNVDYIHNYLIINIKTFFDFYIPSKKIIIETDGDFYHCNPNSDYSEVKYDIQKKNITNDKRKNTWCKNHNIQLIRYWEKDINVRPEWVINDLKNKLNL
jgi:very-short-patch-repair endonuclease